MQPTIYYALDWIVTKYSDAFQTRDLYIIRLCLQKVKNKFRIFSILFTCPKNSLISDGSSTGQNLAKLLTLWSICYILFILKFCERRHLPMAQFDLDNEDNCNRIVHADRRKRLSSLYVRL